MTFNFAFRFWSYAVPAIAFLYSLSFAAEFDLLAVGAPSHGRHEGLELEELLGLSGLFSLLLAGIAVVNGRLATRERRQRSAAETMANVDALTSIANRRFFFERLESAIARGSQPCAVLLMDLDGFKAVNDIHGHAAGDAILVHTARQLAAVAGRQGLAARLGGDEFAVLVEGGDPTPNELAELAGRIRERVSEPVSYCGSDLRVGLSIGWANSSPGTNAAALIEAADGAMYRAKRHNRDREAA